MAELLEVPISDIDSNPFRDPGDPYVEDKIKALMNSFEEVGVWPGMIARRVGNRFQIPFGHSRREAARRLKLKTVPLLVTDINDEQMVGYMGRENAEDYNSDFSVMLTTWKAGVNFRSQRRGNPEPLEVARTLGWVDEHKDGWERMNHTARACDGAFKLINAGHMKPEDFSGLSVRAAEGVVDRVLNRLSMLDKMGALGKRPAKEIEADKKHIASAAREVAKDYREGTIAKTNIKNEIDYRAVSSATKKDKVSPLFAAFAKTLADSIHKMLVDDLASEKLAEMERALALVTMEEDQLALKRVDFALGSLEETTGKWRKRLKEPRGEKVVPFKLLSKGSDVK